MAQLMGIFGTKKPEEESEELVRPFESKDTDVQRLEPPAPEAPEQSMTELSLTGVQPKVEEPDAGPSLMRSLAGKAVSGILKAGQSTVEIAAMHAGPDKKTPPFSVTPEEKRIRDALGLQKKPESPEKAVIRQGFKTTAKLLERASERVKEKHVHPRYEQQWVTQDRHGQITYNNEVLKNPDWWVANAIEMAPTFLAQIAVGRGAGLAATKAGLSAGLARMSASLSAGAYAGLMESTSKYEELINKGVDHDNALRGAWVQALTVGLLNSVAFNRWFKGLPKGGMSKVGAKGLQVATEVITEWAEDPAGAAADAAAGLKPTLEEAWERMQTSLNVMPPTAVMALFMPGSGFKVPRDADFSRFNATWEGDQSLGLYERGKPIPEEVPMSEVLSAEEELRRLNQEEEEMERALEEELRKGDEMAREGVDLEEEEPDLLSEQEEEEYEELYRDWPVKKESEMWDVDPHDVQKDIEETDLAPEPVKVEIYDENLGDLIHSEEFDTLDEANYFRDLYRQFNPDYDDLIIVKGQEQDIPPRPYFTAEDMAGMAPEERTLLHKDNLGVEYYDTPDGLFAFHNGREIGYALPISENPEDGYDITVAKEWTRKGVGGNLLSQWQKKHPGHPTGGLTPAGRALFESQVEPKEDYAEMAGIVHGPRGEKVARAAQEGHGYVDEGVQPVTPRDVEIQEEDRRFWEEREHREPEEKGQEMPTEVAKDLNDMIRVLNNAEDGPVRERARQRLRKRLRPSVAWFDDIGQTIHMEVGEEGESHPDLDERVKKNKGLSDKLAAAGLSVLPSRGWYDVRADQWYDADELRMLDSTDLMSEEEIDSFMVNMGVRRFDSKENLMPKKKVDPSMLDVFMTDKTVPFGMWASGRHPRDRHPDDSYLSHDALKKVREHVVEITVDPETGLAKVDDFSKIALRARKIEGIDSQVQISVTEGPVSKEEGVEFDVRALYTQTQAGGKQGQIIPRPKRKTPVSRSAKKKAARPRGMPKQFWEKPEYREHIKQIVKSQNEGGRKGRGAWKVRDGLKRAIERYGWEQVNDIMHAMREFGHTVFFFDRYLRKTKYEIHQGARELARKMMKEEGVPQSGDLDFVLEKSQFPEYYEKALKQIPKEWKSPGAGGFVSSRAPAGGGGGGGYNFIALGAEADFETPHVVAGHELVHQIRAWAPHLYEPLAQMAEVNWKYAMEWSHQPYSISRRYGYGDKAFAAMKEELIADYLGNHLFTPQFLHKLVQHKNKSFAQRMISRMKSLLSNLRNVFSRYDSVDRRFHKQFNNAEEMLDAAARMVAEYQELRTPERKQMERVEKGEGKYNSDITEWIDAVRGTETVPKTYAHTNEQYLEAFAQVFRHGPLNEKGEPRLGGEDYEKYKDIVHGPQPSDALKAWMQDNSRDMEAIEKRNREYRAANVVGANSLPEWVFQEPEVKDMSRSEVGAEEAAREGDVEKMNSHVVRVVSREKLEKRAVDPEAAREAFKYIDSLKKKKKSDWPKLMGIDANAKTIKGQPYGYMTGIMYMAPEKSSGVMDLCVLASKGCTFSCLFRAGKAAFDKGVMPSRIHRTWRFWYDRNEYLHDLHKEITGVVNAAAKAGMVPVVRLNGTGDLPWEAYRYEKDGVFGNLMEHFPGVTFYDYSKLGNRARDFAAGRLPPNYHITFSRSEDNEEEAVEVLKAGGNVSVVFRDGLPAKWKGFEVINGDESDLRFMDKPGTVVGLIAKGKPGKADDSGFVLDIPLEDIVYRSPNSHESGQKKKRPDADWYYNRKLNRHVVRGEEGNYKPLPLKSTRILKSKAQKIEEQEWKQRMEEKRKQQADRAAKKRADQEPVIKDAGRSYLTAISRKKASAPMTWLKAQGKLKGRILDYGSGRGEDADIFKTERYDPHFSPEMPKGKFDTIVSNFVLNVLSEEETDMVIDDVKSRLKPGGEAYFAVRRDVKEEGFTSRGTFQRTVYLGADFEIVKEVKGGYAIYRMINPKDVVKGGRARAGGERGMNNEFYKGGQFLPGSASTEKGKHKMPKSMKAGRKGEIEPYKWEPRPEDGMYPLMTQIQHFVDWSKYRNNGKVELVDNPRLWESLSAGTEKTAEEIREDAKAAVKAYSKGARWTRAGEIFDAKGKKIKN